MLSKLITDIGKKIIKSEIKRLQLKRTCRSLNIISALKYKTYCTKTKNKDHNDLNNIVPDFFLWNKEYFSNNNFYGISDIFREYSLCNIIPKAAIEHGVYFGKEVMDYEAAKNPTNNIITFSQYRYEVLSEKTKQNIICLGPYIHYVKPFLNEDFHNEKKALGKNLLVFPSHSVDLVTAEYDIEIFLNEIKKIAPNFNTVSVCIYWKDYLMKKHLPYQNAGFKIVSAGHRNDPRFLSRLKSIILLSDITISNSLGTHLGYSIFLNKPHILKIQKQKYSEDKVGAYNNAITNRFVGKNENFYDIIKNEKDVFNTLFSEYTETISKEQYELCNYYWGFDFIKKPEELKSILKSLV